MVGGCVEEEEEEEREDKGLLFKNRELGVMRDSCGLACMSSMRDKEDEEAEDELGPIKELMREEGERAERNSGNGLASQALNIFCSPRKKQNIQ